MTAYLVVAVACLVAAVALGARRLRRKIAVVTVRGLSMQPTLNAGDRLLIRRVSADRLRTGQIVVIERPHQDGASARPAAELAPGRTRLADQEAGRPAGRADADAHAHGTRP